MSFLPELASDIQNLILPMVFLYDPTEALSSWDYLHWQNKPYALRLTTPSSMESLLTVAMKQRLLIKAHYQTTELNTNLTTRNVYSCPPAYHFSNLKYIDLTMDNPLDLEFPSMPASWMPLSLDGFTIRVPIQILVSSLLDMKRYGGNKSTIIRVVVGGLLSGHDTHAYSSEVSSSAFTETLSQFPYLETLVVCSRGLLFAPIALRSLDGTTNSWSDLPEYADKEWADEERAFLADISQMPSLRKVLFVYAWGREMKHIHGGHPFGMDTTIFPRVAAYTKKFISGRAMWVRDGPDGAIPLWTSPFTHHHEYTMAPWLAPQALGDRDIEYLN